MSIFQTAGLMCATPANVPIDLPTIKRLGYSYVSPQAVDGTKRRGASTVAPGSQEWAEGYKPLDQYSKALEAAGLKMVAWSKQYGGTPEEIDAEARAVAETIADIKPYGFSLNPETEFKEDGKWRSRVFVDALKSHLARLGIPLSSVQWAVQPLGGASLSAGLEISQWTFSYDPAPWLELPGVFCVPETYWTPQGGVDGASPSYSPLNCWDAWAVKLGWPKDRFAFTFGWWNDKFASAAEYFANRARTPAPPGFLVYLADQMPAAVIEEFGRGVKAGAALPSMTTTTPPVQPPKPPTTIPDPSAVRTVASANLHTWLDPYAAQGKPQHLSIIRLADRLLKLTGTQQADLNEQLLINELDRVGSPRT